LARRELDQARTQLRRALNLLPQFSDAVADLAEVEFVAGNAQQAISLFRQVIADRPLDLPARRGLAEACRLLKDEQRTYEAYNEWQAVLTAYLDVDTATQLAYRLTQAGRKNEAIVYLREAVRLNPDDREAQALLERLLREAGP
jgi:tetratricopeptide (TPR) repeat protein